MNAVLNFLDTRTPSTWCKLAIENIDTLLLDHATLELKAAHQAQQMIWRYGAVATGKLADSRLKLDLLQQMSRLAREELRHYEQVLRRIAERGLQFTPLSPCSYAATLHENVRKTEPDRLIDTLVVGALIEARSCERFHALVEPLATCEPELAEFYRTLLKSEERHFTDYLALAKRIGDESVNERIDQLRTVEGELMFVDSPELRFHSGVPTG